jgi:hypothetical protein
MNLVVFKLNKKIFSISKAPITNGFAAFFNIIKKTNAFYWYIF